MRTRTLPVVLLVALLVAAAGYAGWKYVHQRQSHACAACLRPVHENTRTVAKVAGEVRGYCCPACALSQHRQSRVPVEVVSLTDHLTGNRIEPAAAFLVRGSDVNSCSHNTGTRVDRDKRPMATHYDRCSPSLLAFASRDSAAGFVREHGGRILRYQNVAEMFR